ncbi:MAG: nucleotidyltransferase domain-containing protein [Actinobacteria bacterium]|nr:nucleotidyltransferase domain-containing protein [Actinomycetota bacterium]
MRLPAALEQFVEELAASAEVVAVAVGGSRALGADDSSSDWDLGVFYRGAVDLSVVAARGEVHAPGSWGRLMNGGAWLTIDGMAVDVILRDVDVVEHWTNEAAAGRYEVDQLLGHLAGFPTYTLTAEVALSKVVRGSIAIDTTFTDSLHEVSTFRWGFQRDFSFEYARAHADRGNAAGALGTVARAITEEAHRRMCDARRWVLNEKRLLVEAGLGGASELLAAREFGRSPRDMRETIGRIEELVKS